MSLNKGRHWFLKTREGSSGKIHKSGNIAMLIFYIQTSGIESEYNGIFFTKSVGILCLFSLKQGEDHE